MSLSEVGVNVVTARLTTDTSNSKRDDPQSGAVNLDLTNSEGDGITIYTHAGYRQNGQALLRIIVDNPQYNDPLIWIKRTGANSNPELRIDSGNPNIEMVETRPDNNLGGGKFEIAVKSDQIQINGRAADNSTFETIVMFSRNSKASGTQNNGEGGMFVRNGGHVIWLDRASNHGVGFRAPEGLAGSVVYTLPDPKDEVDGAVLTADGNHHLSWKKP